MAVVAIVPTGARVATFTTNGGFAAFRLECADRSPIQVGLQAELLFDFYDLLRKAIEAHGSVATVSADMSSETREQCQQAFLSEPIPMVTKSGYAITPDQMTWLPHFKNGSALLIQLSPPIVRLLFDQIDFAVENKVLIDLRPFIGKSWQEMNRAFMQLPVLGIHDRLQAFDFSLELFRRHSRALIEHLESLSGSLTPEQASWRRRYGIEFGIKEAMFRLFDFLSADDAFVNHSLVYYEKFYGSQGQITTYREEVAKRFRDKGLSKFFTDLRNLMVHKGPIGPSHRLSPMRLEGRYQLDRDLLLSSYSKWSAPARQFLANGPKEVDLLRVVQSRVEEIEDFHAWFDRQRQAIHGRDLNEAELLRRAVLARRGLTDMQSLLQLARKPDVSAAMLQEAFADYLTAEDVYDLRELEPNAEKWMEAALLRAQDRYWISDEFRSTMLAASGAGQLRP